MTPRHISAAIAVAGIVYNGVQNIRLINKNEKLKKDNTVLAEELVRANDRTLYLANIIDANDIEITEFDRIAFNNL